MKLLTNDEMRRVGVEMRISETDEAFLADKEYVSARLPRRKRDSNKGDYGKAAIVAGSVEYTGAALLAATACARSGVGYTTLFLPKELVPVFFLRRPEILLKSTNEGGRYAFKPENMQALLGYDGVAYGMGMGVSEDVAEGAAYLLKTYRGKLILDADGLNALAAFYPSETPVLLKNSACEVLLTPHVKEFSRLSGRSVAEIKKNKIEIAKRFAAENGVRLLLKDSASVVTDGKSVTVNLTGNSGQAKAGSGDVLSGVIAGICAMGASVTDGAIVGAYLVGRAAEIAAVRLGEYSTLAMDIVDCLGKAFLEL